MTRVVSALLVRDGIAHTTMLGSLDVPPVGRISLHHWIELGDGRRIDLRARMWLGDNPCVPHGIVLPGDAHAQYKGQASFLPSSPIVFWALTGGAIKDFAPATFLQAPSPATEKC